jgi:predicted outer membrane repeat protein
MKNTLLTLALSALATPLWAIDYIVTRTDDPNPDVFTLPGCTPAGGCSLRQAVLAANKRAGADRIVLARNIYELTLTTATPNAPDGKSGALLVTDALEVVGDSLQRTRVRWASGVTLPHQLQLHQHQVWFVKGQAPFTLARMTISGGRGAFGGCIYFQDGPQASFSDLNIEECTGTSGGAVYVNGYQASILALNRVAFRANRASYGGAMMISGNSTIIANDVALIDNSATYDGGAVHGAYRSLYSAPIGNLNVVWRSEGAGTRFANNVAGRHGGAVALVGPGTANFFAQSSAVPLSFENNLALSDGGAISMNRGYASLESRLIVEYATFTGNSADTGDGGAIALRSSDALVTQSAFESNVSKMRNGGALYSDYSTVTPTLRGSVELRQSSFNENKSQLNGGAIANQCQLITVRDSSFYANQSVLGQGEVISASGDTFLAHVSTDAHGQTNSGPSTLHKSFSTQCGTQYFSIANSVIAGADNCYGQSGVIQSNGGNQFGPYTGGCYFLAGLDQYGTSSTFGLSLGTFGGLKRVLGWNADALLRPQVNFGQSAYCSALDVRGLPRPASACDSGAFEQQ